MSLKVDGEPRTRILQHLDAMFEKQSTLLAKLNAFSLSNDPLEDKIAYLATLPEITSFFDAYPFLKQYLARLPLEAEYALYSLVAIDQGAVVFEGFNELENKLEACTKVLDILLSLERFYEPLGGIIGYHLKVLGLMRAQLKGEPVESGVSYLPPPVYDIRENSEELNELVMKGISTLCDIAELYAVGGAGDRLHLVDEKSNQPLPAARLLFLGKTLFELLIRDLEAREYLFYKLFQKELKTPIVLMTSQEKMNHAEILRLCEKNSWYGRGKESFFFIIQPLTPVVTIEGNWAMSAPCELFLKPGGHGVIWKLAKDTGALAWLDKQKRKALLVRQINNPLAGVDSGLLALSGYGFKHNLALGFTTCARLENLHEGMNVLKEKEGKFAISNLEYTEFSSLKMQSEKKELFVANTNILFASIQEIMQAVDSMPIPGMLVNMKLPVQTLRNKKLVSVDGARLESTMQNIGDAFTAKNVGLLKTYIIVNSRLKTLSVAKRAYDGATFGETPEAAFYDLMKANCDLLSTHCQVKTPPVNSIEEYLKYGPTLIFLYHPALGPLYSIIAQKIRGGDISLYSELNVEIAECDIHNLTLDGSLLIEAHQITGTVDPETKLRQFSEQVGSCTLMNVKVVNRGIDRSTQNCYWKGQIQRKEALKIVLEGNSEFIAENVTFHGAQEICVPANTRCCARPAVDGSIELHFEKMKVDKNQKWKYSVDSEKQIRLQKCT